MFSLKTCHPEKKLLNHLLSLYFVNGFTSQRDTRKSVWSTALIWVCSKGPHRRSDLERHPESGPNPEELNPNTPQVNHTTTVWRGDWWAIRVQTGGGRIRQKNPIQEPREADRSRLKYLFRSITSRKLKITELWKTFFRFVHNRHLNELPRTKPITHGGRHHPPALLVFTPDLCSQTSFFPLFAKVVMFWCGRVPAAAALLFCSVALFAEMCSAIQFHLPVSHRSWGSIREEEQWSSSCSLHCFHFLCVHISDTCEDTYVSSP